MQQVKGKR